jgi:hypothetical protein
MEFQQLKERALEIRRQYVDLERAFVETMDDLERRLSAQGQ